MKAAAAALAVALAVAVALVARLRPLRDVLSWRTSPPSWDPHAVLSPVHEAALIAQNDGKQGRPALLVILGEVYNVTGAPVYSAESGYSVFIGRDSTSAFSTGRFDNNAELDDVSALTPSQLRAIEDWVNFYRKHDNYSFVGVMHGRFYDAQGRRTEAWHAARHKMGLAEVERAELEALVKRFPHCNTKWTDKTGHEISCDQRGGDALFVPRILVYGDAQRCACVDPSSSSSSSSSKAVALHTYPDCGARETVCKPKAIPDMRPKPQAPASVVNTHM